MSLSRDRRQRLRTAREGDWLQSLLAVRDDRNRRLELEGRRVAASYLLRYDGFDATPGEVVFDPMFQGGAGRVHGGTVAGSFDDIAGHIIMWS